MAKPTKTFYIFHGADDIALRDTLGKMRAVMGEYGDMNTSEFDGSVTSVPEILNAVSSYPFLSDRRLVIVRGLLAALTGEAGRKAQAQLVEAIPELPEHARLVLVESGKIDARNAVLKAAADLPNAVVRAFDVPEDVAGWIVKRAGLYDVTIEPRAAAALADVAGADLHALDSELSKLADYVHPRTEITEDDVAAMTTYVPEANIFKLVDAIAKGDGSTAMQLFHRLLKQEKQSEFSIFGMIMRQFRLLILAREFIDTGIGGSLAAVTGTRGYAAEQFGRLARTFTAPDLERIHHRLLDADIAMKTGEMTPQMAIDLLIADLSD